MEYTKPELLHTEAVSLLKEIDFFPATKEDLLSFAKRNSFPDYIVKAFSELPDGQTEYYLEDIFEIPESNSEYFQDDDDKF